MQKYIRVANNIIKEITISSAGSLEEKGYIPVSSIQDIHVGSDVKMYDKDWKKRPLVELVEEGLVELQMAGEGNSLRVPDDTPIQRIVDGEIIDLTIYDLAVDGLVELGDFEYIDHEKKEIIELEPEDPDTDRRLVELGRITEEERLIRAGHRVRNKRDDLITELDWRYTRYYSEQRQGLDPTDDIAELDAYIQALRDIPQQEGFPDDVVWPEEPKKGSHGG